jgi:hypothetical protein
MRISGVYWVVGGVALAYAIKFGVNQFTAPPDDVMIHHALDEAVQASREGRPGGVTDHLSQTFTINNFSFGDADISRYIRDHHPDVTVSYRKPKIDGAFAEMDAPVSITFRLLSFEQTVPVPNVKLMFHKEEGHDWMGLPVREWRLSSVEVPDTSVSNLSAAGE